MRFSTLSLLVTAASAAFSFAAPVDLSNGTGSAGAADGDLVAGGRTSGMLSGSDVGNDTAGELPGIGDDGVARGLIGDIISGLDLSSVSTFAAGLGGNLAADLGGNVAAGLGGTLGSAPESLVALLNSLDSTTLKALDASLSGRSTGIANIDSAFAGLAAGLGGAGAGLAGVVSAVGGGGGGGGGGITI